MITGKSRGVNDERDQMDMIRSIRGVRFRRATRKYDGELFIAYRTLYGRHSGT